MVSLDQDRNDSSEDNLFLGDIQTQSDSSLLDEIVEDEFKRNLLKSLYNDLSPFERHVFMMYLQRKSYEDIADRVIANRKPKKKIPEEDPRFQEYKIKVVKSVDNALSRIKHKGRTLKDSMAKD
jgi:hypothetical protein